MFLLASVGLPLSEPANKFLSKQIERKTSSSQTKQKTYLNCIRDSWVLPKSFPVNSGGPESWFSDELSLTCNSTANAMAVHVVMLIKDSSYF